MLGVHRPVGLRHSLEAAPSAAFQMGYTEEEGYIVSTQQRAAQALQAQLTVAGTMEKVVMIEAGADEFPDDMMLEAIMSAARGHHPGAHPVHPQHPRPENGASPSIPA